MKNDVFIVENFPLGGGEQTVLSEPLEGMAPWPPSGSAYGSNDGSIVSLCSAGSVWEHFVGWQLPGRRSPGRITRYLDRRQPVPQSALYGAATYVLSWALRQCGGRAFPGASAHSRTVRWKCKKSAYIARLCCELESVGLDSPVLNDLIGDQESLHALTFCFQLEWAVGSHSQAGE